MVILGGRMGRRKRFGVEVKGKGRILSMGLLISFYSFYSVYAATRGSEFYGTGHIRPGEASGRI